MIFYFDNLKNKMLTGIKDLDVEILIIMGNKEFILELYKRNRYLIYKKIDI